VAKWLHLGAVRLCATIPREAHGSDAALPAGPVSGRFPPYAGLGTQRAGARIARRTRRPVLTTSPANASPTNTVTHVPGLDRADGCAADVLGSPARVGY
jgi:hypothetical protein